MLIYSDKKCSMARFLTSFNHFISLLSAIVSFARASKVSFRLRHHKTFVGHLDASEIEDPFGKFPNSYAFALAGSMRSIFSYPKSFISSDFLGCMYNDIEVRRFSAA